MATLAPEVSSVEPIAQSQPAWDSFVAQHGGHLLQSWKWGEFKARHGWIAERILVENEVAKAGAQVLFRRGGPFSIAYIPRGPVVPPNDAQSTSQLFSRIDEVCRSHRALHLIVEPNDHGLDLHQPGFNNFVEGPSHFQPVRTVKVPLLADDELIAQMHQKTRYNVRLAQRRGVVVERAAATPSDVDVFYQLMEETSERNEFGIHSRQYYADFVDVFRSDALMLFARVDGEVAAGLVAARFGKEAIYMYGGSSTKHRAHGAAFLLQFVAMQWARDEGCSHYDLWGIPEQDPAPAHNHGDRVTGTKGDDWRGLYRFKTGFGGEIVTYPSTIERRYRPILSYLVRRKYGNRV